MQFPESRLYEGNVTKATDDLFGVEAVKWDASLKLEYCMEIVGGAGVKTDSVSLMLGLLGLFFKGFFTYYLFIY